jgi:hypothetical protein
MSGVNSHYNDPFSMSVASPVVSGKEVHEFISYDKDENELELSVYYRWKKFGNDIEVEYEVVSYPKGVSRQQVNEDAEESIKDEVLGLFNNSNVLFV